MLKITRILRPFVPFVSEEVPELSGMVCHKAQSALTARNCRFPVQIALTFSAEFRWRRVRRVRQFVKTIMHSKIDTTGCRNSKFEVVWGWMSSMAVIAGAAGGGYAVPKVTQHVPALYQREFPFHQGWTAEIKIWFFAFHKQSQSFTRSLWINDPAPESTDLPFSNLLRSEFYHWLWQEKVRQKNTISWKYYEY
jgi:hypothetical protein